MRNVLVIDGAANCVYDIFEFEDADFEVVFSPGTDIAFIDDVCEREGVSAVDAALTRAWARRVPKASVLGIHGTLYFQLQHKKAYYPTLKDEEAINPDGTRLR